MPKKARAPKRVGRTTRRTSMEGELSCSTCELACVPSLWCVDVDVALVGDVEVGAME